MDRDHDGMLSKNDIFNIMKKVLPKEEARKKVKSMFLNMNTSNSGKISYSEFIAASMGPE